MGFIALICLMSQLSAVIASLYAEALAPEFIVLDDLETPLGLERTCMYRTSSLVSLDL